MLFDRRSTVSWPAYVCPECCFGVKAGTWTLTVEVPAPDELRSSVGLPGGLPRARLQDHIATAESLPP